MNALDTHAVVNVLEDAEDELGRIIIGFPIEANALEDSKRPLGEAGGGVPDGLGTLAFLFRQDFWTLFFTHTLSYVLYKVYESRKRLFDHIPMGAIKSTMYGPCREI